MAEQIEASLELDLSAALRAIDDLEAGLALALEAGAQQGINDILSEIGSTNFDSLRDQLESALSEGAGGLSDALGQAVDTDASIDATVTGTEDVEALTTGLEAVEPAATDASSGLNAFTAQASQLQGLVGQLPGPLGQITGLFRNLSPATTATAAGLTLLAAAGFKFVDAAIESRAAQERLNAVFQDAAPLLDRIKVGDQTQTLEEFAASLGSADESLQTALASFGRLGVQAGASTSDVAALSTELAKLGARGIESGRFTDLGEAVNTLSGAFVRGGKALRDFGINLSSAQITEEAVRQTGKAADQLTAYDKTVAGVALSQRQLGGAIDESIVRTRQFTDVLSRAAEQQRDIASERAGEALVDSFLELKAAADELLAGLAQIAGSLLQILEPALAGLGPLIGIVADGFGLAADFIGTFSDQISVLAGAVLFGVGALKALSVASFLAQSGLAATTIAARGFVAALGPIGLVVAGISLIASAFGDSGEAAKKSEERNDAAATSVAALADAYRDLAAGIITSSEATTASVSALDTQLNKIFESAPKSAAEAEAAFAAAGVSAEDLTKGLTGTATELDAVGSAVIETKSAYDAFAATIGPDGEIGKGIFVFRKELEATREALLKQAKAAVDNAENTGLITKSQADAIRASKDYSGELENVDGIMRRLSEAEQKRVADLANVKRASADTAVAVTTLIDAIQSGTVDETFISEFAEQFGVDAAKLEVEVERLTGLFDGLQSGFEATLPGVADALDVGRTQFEAGIDAYVASFDDASEEARAGAAARGEAFREATTGWIDPQATLDALNKQLEAIRSFVPNIQLLLSQGFTALASEAAAQGPAFAAQLASGIIPPETLAELNARFGEIKTAAQTGSADFAAILPSLFAGDIAAAATELGIPLEKAFSDAITFGTVGAADAAKAAGVQLPGALAEGVAGGEADARAEIKATVDRVLSVGDAIAQAIGFLANQIDVSTTLENAFRIWAIRSVTAATNQFQDELARLQITLRALLLGVAPAAAKAGETVGIAFGAGLAIGIRSQESVITRAARDVARAAENAAKKQLGIASPSKVGEDIGHFFGDGLVAGLRAEMANVAAASAALVGTPANTSALLGGVPTNAAVQAAAIDPRLVSALNRLADSMPAGRGDTTINVTADGRRANNGFLLGRDLSEAIR
jgi:hypothetical protein